MAVDIIDPTYWISELFGGAMVFSMVLFFGIMYLIAKQRLNFQWGASILVLSFLMIGMIFPGFLSWIPLIITIIGFILGPILMRLIERN